MLVCKPQTCCIGKARIATSVKMFGIALPMNEALRLMQ